MKGQKFLKIFLTVIASMILSFTVSVSAVETKAEENEDLHILWIQDYENDGELANFAIKTTAKNTQTRENFQSDAFEYITVNGYTLKDITEADKKASVKLDGIYLRVTLSATGYKYCLKETEEDRIVIEKGFSFISGEVTPYDFTYTWDKIFNKYMVIPDPTLLDESQISSALLRDVVFDSTNDRQLFIHFSYPVGLEYMSCIQYDPEGMAQQFRSIGWSYPSDLYISQLSLFGIRDSILNNILVDGVSLAEWLEEDGPYVADPQNLILISVHGVGRDRGRYLTVEFGYASSCMLSDNEEHTLTLKGGLLFPTLFRLNDDITLTYNPETDVWGAGNAESEIESMNTQQTSEGCNSTMDMGLATTCVGLALAFAKRVGRNKKEGNCNEE